MNKHLVRIIGGTLFLLISTYILIFRYDNQLNEEENLNLPNRLGSYQDMGYYKIDPETILASLGNGEANVFMPLLKDPQDITEDVTNMTISWTQIDFLKIASALSRFAWNDPMNPEEWNIYYISFRGSCNDPVGFDYANITYFKIGKKRYATRLIEINPYLGLVSWGDGETYPKPILQKWNSVDLLGAKFTADDALQMASDDAKERFQFKENCGVLMSTPQNSDPKNWYLHFFGASDFILYKVNLDTGNLTYRKLNK